MPNPVLDSYRAQREQQVENIDSILGQVEGRDLTDAERGLLDTARERIRALDDQIRPLAEFEAIRDAHETSVRSLPRPADRVEPQPRPAAGIDRSAMQYRSAGAFMVDLLRSEGIMERGIRDDQATARVMQARAVANNITTDIPGILPQPIVGTVVSLIDANRPLITSLGGTRALGNIPGTQFTRPKITQHTQAGKQTAEKTELPSRKLTIAGVPFTKETHGGTVDISRQAIDWSSPAAWDIIVRDLADQYAIDTETTVAGAFVTAATGTKPPALPAAPVLADWTKALYTAGMHSYSAGQRMPGAIWCSLDVWAALGSLVDTTRVVLPQDRTSEMGAPGTSTLADFRGDMLGLPRVVVPLFPAKTCIVGPLDLYEVYEEVIGLLSVVEPSILGVTVAYGGYVAYGSLGGAAYVPLDLSAVTSLPTMAALDVDVEPDADDASATGGNGGARRAK